ncbi:MAG: enoyl-CoA hydratase/isomerase family protein [Roseiflexaceae bacterium]|nr:enoyl-CoA hydratase/isomerase family protein [Roseiflexaceae bacterium]
MIDKILTRRDGAVLTLTLHNPRLRNALDREMADALRDQIERCGDETRVIVLGGAGGAFCSGADLTVLVGRETPADPDQIIRVLTEGYHPLLRAIRAAPCPVIAAVDGSAAGIGCDLALACDLRLVSERAQFAELFINVGLVPDGGGTWTLPRLIGLGRALELMYTGAAVAAAEAVQIGLANRVLANADFAAEVAAFAQRLAAQAPNSLRRIRQAVYAAQELTFEQALAEEARHQLAIFHHPDGFEGFRAFLEKRAPVWTG